MKKTKNDKNVKRKVHKKNKTTEKNSLSKTESSSKQLKAVKKTKKVSLKNKDNKKPLKKEIKHKSKYRAENLQTDTEILNMLNEAIPSLVNSVVKRYKNSFLAPVFNNEDMTALAEDISLDVLNRIRTGKVDLIGACSYFKTSFRNHTIKIYEKHGRTDIRAGIKTSGTMEAMSVASSRNLVFQEDKWVIQDLFTDIKDFLLSFDKENQSKTLFLFKSMLIGKNNKEIQEELSFSVKEFNEQKELMEKIIKERFPNIIEEYAEHFSVEEDYRIYTQSVNKRMKLNLQLRDYKIQKVFYLQDSVKEGKLSLVAKIELLDKYDNKIKVPAKIIKIKEIKNSATEKERKELLSLSKKENIVGMLTDEIQRYVNTLQ